MFILTCVPDCKLKDYFHRIYWNIDFKTKVCWFELSIGPYCARVSNKLCLLTFFISSNVAKVVLLLMNHCSYGNVGVLFLV